MNELSIIHKNGVDVIDSREVAEVIGKPHNDLMKSIRNYAEILAKATEPKIGLNENAEESNERKIALVEKSTESNFGLSEKSTERKSALSEKSTAGNFSLSDFFIPNTPRLTVGKEAM